MIRFFKNCIAILFIFMTISVGYSQGTMKLLKNKKKQSIRFKLSNNLIVIPVTINGKELSFILDSGASKTLIFGMTEIDSLHLKNTKKIKLFGLGVGKAIEGVLSKNNLFELKNIVGVNQDIYVIPNKNYDLTTKMGNTIHGIIGYNLFKDFVVTINYRRKKIIFHDPKTYRPPHSRRYKKFDLTFYHSKPYLNATLNLTGDLAQQVNLLIDSGNSDALWIFENNKLDLHPKNKYFTDYLGEGLNGVVTGKRSKIKNFSIGDFVFKNPTTAFLDSTATQYVSANRYRQGSIGSQILQRFKVILDYQNKKLYLKKTRSLKKEFKYNRAGIELAYAGKTIVKTEKIVSDNYAHNEGNIISFEFVSKFHLEPIYQITRIRKNSVAEKAGLKVHDILIDIQGKAAYRYKYKEIINFFYDDIGSEITLSVMRKGYRVDTHFILEKLL